MYDSETDEVIDAESYLSRHEDMNTILATIKEALRQVAQVDIELKNARELRATRPQFAKQIELAEEFYIAERKRLLDLEDHIPRLNSIYVELVSLLEEYDAERLTLEGRSLIVEHGRVNNVDTASIREEVRLMLPRLIQRREKASVMIQEINDVLQEYSSAVHYENRRKPKEISRAKLRQRS